MIKRGKSRIVAPKLRGKAVKRRISLRKKGTKRRLKTIVIRGKGRVRGAGRTLVKQNNSYNQAYDAGFDASYNEGFNVGYAEGMEAGHQEAYKGE